MKWWHWLLIAAAVLLYFREQSSASIGTLGTVSSTTLPLDSFWEDLTGGGGAPTLTTPPVVASGGLTKQSSALRSHQAHRTPGFFF